MSLRKPTDQTRRMSAQAQPSRIKARLGAMAHCSRARAICASPCGMPIGWWQAAKYTLRARSVSGGVFAVEVDFGNQFKGEARWMETEAKCADDAGYTALPRTGFDAAPYAIGLLPGAVISGTGSLGVMINTPNGNALARMARATYATVYSSDGSPNGGYAVYGDTPRVGRIREQHTSVWRARRIDSSSGRV